MSLYLGTIEKYKTFYSFIPKMELIDKKLEKKDFDSIFPPYGKFNLAYEYTDDDAYQKLENLIVEIDQKSLFVINIDENQIEDNFSLYNPGMLVNSAHKKVNLISLLQSGLEFESIIQSINNNNIYKIVSPISELKEDSFTRGQIEVSEGAFIGEQVMLLCDDSTLCGPYVLRKQNTSGGAYYVKPELETKNYIKYYYIDGENAAVYHFESYDIVVLESSPYYNDIIPNFALISEFVDDYPLSESSLQKDNLNQLINSSSFLKEGLPEDVKKARIQKVSDILNNLSDLSSNDEAILLEKLTAKTNKTIVDQEEFESLVKEKRRLETEGQATKDENAELINRITDLNNKIEELESTEILSTENAKQELEEIEAEITHKKQENSNLEKKISENTTIIELGKKIDQLEGVIAYLKNSEGSLINKIEELNKQKNLILSQIQTEIKSITENPDYAKVAFDPYISSLMLETAADWYKGEEDNSYNAYVSTLRSSIDIDNTSITKEELIQYLYSFVRQERDYTKNEIINIYTCIAQGFITFFAGNPGSGKTSICNIVSKSLSLDNQYGTSFNRYASVSVERGWTSKRDLIGYYNPLTQKYDKANGKIYDALRIVNEENKNSQLPYFILLDEANLSQIEYYWSEFMKAADLVIEQGAYIDIGEKKEIYMPKTLRFLATVNIDETTEQISPRLIDRSWIIKLPERNMDYKKPEEIVDPKTILWLDFENTFKNSETNEIKYNNVLQNIYKIFEDSDLFVSRRIRNSIEDYLRVAQNLMEDSTTGNAAQQAMDFAVVQRLLPKINGTYSRYENLFRQIKSICDSNNLIMTKAAIETMEKSQDQNMGYCQYLA